MQSDTRITIPHQHITIHVHRTLFDVSLRVKQVARPVHMSIASSQWLEAWNCSMSVFLFRGSHSHVVVMAGQKLVSIREACLT
jgi:hypothetical protein